MIGITIGDISGVGPEIVLKALVQIKNPERNVRLIGSHQLLVKLAKQLKINTSLENLVYDIPLLAEKNPVNPVKIEFGKPQKQCGISSALQLHLASHLLKVGKIHGIVTAPVSKTALSMTGFPFPGQTEYFAAEFGVKKYGMLAWSEQLKIILVTIHQPLKDVPKLITAENVLEKIILLNNYMKHYEKKRKPKIGVLALNPHAFEFTCGAEESIWKAIKYARKLGISVDGPIPADSAFLLPSPFSLLPKYDAFVAMYHDQGMLPVKLLSQGSGACPAPFSKKDSSKCNLTGKTQASFKNWCGVNMTLGLPFIRTSPLHGVAFDIAGKNIADPSSMISAINLCLKLTKN